MKPAGAAWKLPGVATVRGPMPVATVWLLLGCAIAQASPPGDPVAVQQGVAQPDPGIRVPKPCFREVARDPIWRERASFGLQRQVRMYQWQAGDGYSRIWSESRLDSTRFAPGHENPASLPLHSERWVAGDIRIDDKPLDPAVIAELGEWKPFRPGFSSLPANLAATFQPEGDGLGTAQNPMDPQIGDLRIRWRELVLPSLAGRVVLQGGRWVLAPQAHGVQTVSQEHIGKGHGLSIAIGLLIVLLALALHHRQHRRSKPDKA